ncbi:hypothetical protein FBQ80_17780, partial [Candidatus Brocadia sp. AMX2]|uniref:hypothetical protein n=1 Tax=Candidatus Brocadia sp. AMX2 TaxID=2293635 RepID=UPI002552A0CB
MTEAIGWLLDVFAEEDGITLWVLAEDGERLHLHMDFDITLYVAGDFSLLRQAWKYLRKKNVRLERT